MPNDTKKSVAINADPVTWVGKLNETLGMDRTTLVNKLLSAVRTTLGPNPSRLDLCTFVFQLGKDEVVQEEVAQSLPLDIQ